MPEPGSFRRMRTLVSTITGLLALACGAAWAEVAVIDLRCENRIDPLGVDVAIPRFSWKTTSEARNEEQTAYQIVVDGVWDSGKVDSSRSVLVEYEGPALIPTTDYRWKVRVWDAAGNPSEYSEPARFSTGLDSWSAAWIGLDEPASTEHFGAGRWIWYPEGNPASSAPVGTRHFEKEFELDGAPERATLLVTADNAFEVFVNGEPAGSGDKFSDPGRFDVASLLHAGTNLIRVNAANVGTAPNPAGLIVRLSAVVAGSATEVVTDASWKASRNGTEWTAAHVMGAYGSAPWGTMDTREVPARYLRKEFGTEPAKEVARATAYVCGLGFFDFFLNGEKVSDHVMDPALSDYRKAAYYVTFDVTENINSGANAIGVILGNGRFMAPRTKTPAVTQTFGFPKLLAQIEIEYSDGSKQTVVSDASWKITDNGPIRSNNEYDGEHYDARMEMPGWNDVDFDESGWMDVEMVAAPGGELVSQLIEPMRITRIVEPISISNPSPGTYIVDMGEAFYGTVRLKASAPAGTTVRMTSAYSLLPDGNLKTADNRDAKCTDQYIFKGDGLEVWNPRFKGQGFRRVEITGFPGEPTLDNFEGLVIHTDVETVGSFECSNPLINDIHASLLRGARMFLRSAPLDPDRDERQAWMGDSSKNAEFEAYNFNVAPFYSKWMDDVQRSQRADGSIPDVSMYWDWGQGVEWPAVFTIIPDWYIDFYGDSRVAGTHYEAMKTWVLAMRRHEEPDGTLRSTSYGDWCDVSTMFKTSDANGATPGNLISSAYQYRNYRIMERLAGRSGLAEDEGLFAGLASRLKSAFNARFFNPATHVYHGDTQCAYVLALQFGLVPDEHRQAVIDKLVDNVMLRHKGHLSVGLIGMQWLMQTLTDVGRSDVAWNIVTRTERPGWGYMLSKGATTIWERWDGDTKDGSMNSESLLILAGNLDGWFYQTLAGIRPTSEGFKTFKIQPELLGDLEWAKAEFDSPHGVIASHWTIDSPTSVSLRAAVPPNTRAVVHFPLSKLRNATIREGELTLWTNGEFVAGDSAIGFDGSDEHEVRFLVGSGDYRFSASGSPVPSSGFSVIVDDDDEGAVFAGSWTRATDTEADQRYGFSFRYAPSGNGSSTAEFRPNLPESGKYRVYALWTAHANRATDTPFTIRHAGGDTLVRVNQEENGGVWNELGTFDFDADGESHVKITNEANQFVIADAVKFERVVEEGDVSAYDDWIRSFFPTGSDPQVIGRHADPDGDGVSNLLEFALNGNPGDGGARGLVRPIPGSSGTGLGMAALREGQLTQLPEGPVRIEALDAGIIYFVEGSIDLVDWTLPVTHLWTADLAFGELPDLGATPWTYHAFGLDHSGSGETPEKGFLRVRVSDP